MREPALHRVGVGHHLRMRRQRRAPTVSAGRSGREEIADDPPHVRGQSGEHVVAGEHRHRPQHVDGGPGRGQRRDHDRRGDG